MIDALTRPKARYRYGGGPMFLVNVAVETIFFLLLSPIMWFAHTVFLATLVFGGSVGWGGFYALFVIAASIHAGIGIRNVLAEWSPLTERAAGIAALLFAVLLSALGLRAVMAVTL